MLIYEVRTADLLVVDEIAYDFFGPRRKGSTVDEI
jgi:hypothetical protein